jgi:hypothetical protein
VCLQYHCLIDLLANLHKSHLHEVHLYTPWLTHGLLIATGYTMAFLN